MNFNDKQFLQFFGWLLRDHAEIVSGAYKNRKIYHGTNGPELTDNGKLEDCMQKMTRHMQFIGELVDNHKE